MLDVVITGARVVTPAGVGDFDIGIEGEKIVVVAARGQLPEYNARVVDGRGMIAVPGGIDPHVHTSWLVPTAAQEGINCADAEQVSRAAVYGGTTTLIDFAIWRPGITLAKAYEEKAADWSDSYTDFALHGTFKGEIPFETIAEIGDAIQDGHTSFKVWMTNATPSRPPQKTDLGYMWGILEQTRDHGGMLAVHAEDDEIVMYSYKKLAHEGRWDFPNVHLAHNTLSEALSFRRVIGLAERVGAPIYLMHVSAAEGVAAIAESRAKGFPIYGETLQHYLSFNAEAYKKENGQIYHTYPSLKPEEDRLALWKGLQDGVLSTVATDEMCTDLATKVRGKTIDDVTGGHAGVEARMGLMYSEIVNKRNGSLNDFVDATSANAAKIMGLYPQKGAIAVGSDADIVLMRPIDERLLSYKDMHETDYSAWDGYPVSCWPQMTMLRGRVLVEHGTLVVTSPSGRLPKRSIATPVLEGPAC
ncbi:dihydroorotase [Specibacter cremeus]|uniref:dihydroorotase n=1 Tax=Specibacter cremeus TaxID=1629051 RepID=UPI0013DE4C30|nr:amidohydrolase family protein [Specibacter cremeus]